MSAEPLLLGYLAACLGLAGFAKGLSGTGLPIIAVPLMTLALDLRLAVALITLSLVGSNLVQAAASGQVGWAVRRYRLVIVAIPAGTAVGAWLLSSVDPGRLESVAGGLVIAFVLLNMAAPAWRLPERAEGAAAPLAGFLGGVVGGITAIFAPPLVLFLLWTGQQKERFVAALAVFYLVASVSLTLFLASFALMDAPLLVWSAAAFLPVLAGQLAGTRLRRRIPEPMFRLSVQVILLGAGAKMLLQ